MSATLNKYVHFDCFITSNMTGREIDGRQLIKEGEWVQAVRDRDSLYHGSMASPHLAMDRIHRRLGGAGFPRMRPSLHPRSVLLR